MKIVIVSLLIILSFKCLADGLPINDKGQIDVPHSIIKLNESQIEELEALGSVTLSKSEWYRLRKKSSGIPKRIDGILPITHSDCACGCNAILLRDDRLVILHDDDAVRNIKYKFDPDNFGGKNASLALYVDRRGQFYLNGVLIPYKSLLAGVKQSKNHTAKVRKKLVTCYYDIIVPPGMKETHKVFEDRITGLKKELHKRGWVMTRLTYP